MAKVRRSKRPRCPWCKKRMVKLDPRTLSFRLGPAGVAYGCKTCPCGSVQGK